MDRAETVARLRKLARRRRTRETALDAATSDLRVAILEAIDNGMTVADVARFTGYHRNNVSRIHNDRLHD